MESAHSESEEEARSELPNPLDEVIDIPSDVFINSHGIPPPPTKRRGDIMDFEQELHKKAFTSREEAFKAETTAFKLQKALTQNTSDYNIATFMRSITETLTRMENESRNTNRKIENMDRKLDQLQNDITEIKPLMFYVRTSENARRRNARVPPIPVPFLVGTGPGDELPILDSVETIENLDSGQLRRYLQGYAVQFNPRSSSKILKNKLREALGFYAASDLSFEFS